jgi:bifunctional DNA-binding transcriptional regulator/antitoxin component of YhaV-PrlF toxin-antitoxin module
MTQSKQRRKVVRAQAKGQVTIPREFREVLGIDAETLLSISLVGDHLEITPLRQGDEVLRRYTEQDIARFLEEDRLDEGTARRVRGLLKRGAL